MQTFGGLLALALAAVTGGVNFFLSFLAAAPLESRGLDRVFATLLRQAMCPGPRS